MREEAWSKGVTRLDRLGGKHAVDTLYALEEEFPELAEHIVQTFYGEIFEDNGLEPREQSFVTIASLTSQGAFEQLDFHFRLALSVGITEEELRGTLLHLLAYIGVPKVLSAYNVLKSITDK